MFDIGITESFKYVVCVIRKFFLGQIQSRNNFIKNAGINKAEKLYRNEKCDYKKGDQTTCATYQLMN